MNVQKFPRFFLGLAVGVLFSVTAAYAINADNTPDNGYLLCVNSKTKAVTYPGVLKCPSGSKPLELGAQGAEGPMGVTGPTGATGQSADVKAMGTLTLGAIEPRDVALPSSSVSRRLILAAFTDKTFDEKTGTYLLSVDLSGGWATPSEVFNFGEVYCYFQDLSIYNATPNNTGARGVSYQGSARAGNDGSFNFSMHVTGTFAISKSPSEVLACWSNRSVIGLTGQVLATWYPTGSNLFPIPISQAQ